MITFVSCKDRNIAQGERVREITGKKNIRCRKKEMNILISF